MRSGLSSLATAARILATPAVDFELDAVFFDPRAVGVDVQPCILVRHLLEANHDLHGARSPVLRNPERGCPGGGKAGAI
jgi:hypothetical protein